MPDMLVNLLTLPPLEPLLAELRRGGFDVRRAAVWEMSAVRRFVSKHFTEGWADEISNGYANKPVSIYIALHDRRIVGFGAYECTRRNFFGPTGVAEGVRGRGIGKSLLLACLWGLREMGYVYGIIGGAGPTEFYERAVGAVIIDGSMPGIYADPLRPDAEN